MIAIDHREDTQGSKEVNRLDEDVFRGRQDGQLDTQDREVRVDRGMIGTEAVARDADLLRLDEREEGLGHENVHLVETGANGRETVDERAVNLEVAPGDLPSATRPFVKMLIVTRTRRKTRRSR